VHNRCNSVKLIAIRAPEGLWYTRPFIKHSFHPPMELTSRSCRNRDAQGVFLRVTLTRRDCQNVAPPDGAKLRMDRFLNSCVIDQLPGGAGGEAVNRAVRGHQLGAVSWDDQALVAALYRMCDALAASVFGDAALATVLISLTGGGCRRSRYRAQRDGLAIRHVVEFDARWVRQLDDFQRFTAIAYELTHAWQAACGAPPCDGRIHNRQFRDKARAIGLHVGERRGKIIGVSEAFFPACRAARIAMRAKPAASFPLPPVVRKGTSTPRKWTCGCQILYSGRRAVRARCEDCGQPFAASPQKLL